MAVLKTVVLVHGFFRRGRNMRYLARKLEELGYRVFAPTLPAVFQNVRACGESLAQAIEGIEKIEKIAGGGVVHFVGHSMGGLVIRDCLSRRVVRRLGRVVLIGTPNGGSPYANLLLGFPFSRQLIEGLSDLAEPGPDIPPPLNVPAPEIGVIIGTRPDPVRQILLPGEHDGLVSAESVRRVAASGEILIPCPHERLHWRTDTAEAVASFLETGKFLPDERYSLKLKADGKIFHNKKIKKKITMDPKTAGKVLALIVSNPEILGRLDMPNIDIPTIGGQVLWNNLAELGGWRIQENTLTKHCRILDPYDVRRAWGGRAAMKKIFRRLTETGQET